MLTYLVHSNERRTIDGLGVFEKGQVRLFTEGDVAWFERCRGVPLKDGNVPEGVTVTVLTGVHKEDEEVTE